MPEKDAELTPEERRRVQRLDALANVLDNSIPVPGTRMRFGLDALIGLIPGFGDAAGGAISAYIVLQAARFGAPVTVLARMLLNVLVEAAVGTIPLVGDLFDAGYKANLRNVALLRRSIEVPGPTRRSSALVVLLVALALLGILVLFGVATFLVLQALVTLASGRPVQL